MYVSFCLNISVRWSFKDGRLLKVGDMDRIKEICEQNGIIMVEDCAHSLGVRYKGVHTGHHGVIIAFHLTGGRGEDRQVEQATYPNRDEPCPALPKTFVILLI